jgi:hypothetical protein
VEKTKKVPLSKGDLAGWIHFRKSKEEEKCRKSVRKNKSRRGYQKLVELD